MTIRVIRRRRGIPVILAIAVSLTGCQTVYDILPEFVREIGILPTDKSPTGWKDPEPSEYQVVVAKGALPATEIPDREDGPPRLESTGRVRLWHDGNAGSDVVDEGLKVLGGPIFPIGERSYELDAPLATAVRADGSGGTQYFAFTVSIGLSEPGPPALLLARLPNTQPLPNPENPRWMYVRYFEQVPGLCEPLESDNAQPVAARPNWKTSLWSRMEATSRRFTGRSFYAAPTPEIERLLDRGIPVALRTCRSLTRAKAQATAFEYELAVLVPEGTLASGRRLAIAEPFVGGRRIDLELYPAPITIAVLGDSTSWGQGNVTPAKDWYKAGMWINKRLRPRFGQPDRPRRRLRFAKGFTWEQDHVRWDVPAHSGATTWTPTILHYQGDETALEFGFPVGPVVPVQETCGHGLLPNDRAERLSQVKDYLAKNDAGERKEGLTGEIPREEPPLVCQAGYVASRLLNPETGEELGHGGISGHTADTENPNNGTNDTPLIDYRERDPRIQRGQWFDYGPRYDYVLFKSCINDIGAASNVIGGRQVMQRDDGPDTEDGTDLQSQTLRRCDMRAVLVKFRELFPNAKIVVSGYHNIISNESRYCPNPRTPAQESANRAVYRIVRDEFREGAERGAGYPGDRADIFQKESELELDRSVTAVRRAISEIRHDRSEATAEKLATELGLDRDSMRAAVRRLGDGRGSVMFAPVRQPPNPRLESFDRHHAMGLGHQASWVYSLMCNPGDLRAATVAAVFGGKLGRAYHSEDDDRDLRDDRERVCNAFIANEPGASRFYSSEEGQKTGSAREFYRAFCHRAAAFHPNPKGTKAFWKSICIGLAEDAGLAVGKVCEIQ